MGQLIQISQKQWFQIYRFYLKLFYDNETKSIYIKILNILQKIPDLFIMYKYK